MRHPIVLVACYGHGLSKLIHLMRPFEIAKALNEAGYQIHFAGSGERLTQVVQERFSVFPLSEIDLDYAEECESRQGFVSQAYDSLCQFVDEEIKLLKKVRPDVILCDYRRSLSLFST